jgi:hypothetical protein
VARSVAITALVALAAALVAGSTSARSTPRCFGAASRDPEHPCKNSALRRMVKPRPSTALVSPDPTPCEPVEGAVPPVCEFGAPVASAKKTVALVGDSHADHWRSAVYPVARKLGWHVYSVTHGSCPLTKSWMDAPEGTRNMCLQWNDDVQEWFKGHPEVSAILTSSHPGPVVREPGETMMDAWVKGYVAAWDALPANVQHIVALRDVPFANERTAPCIERAIRRKRDASRACARPRTAALHHDATTTAAKRVPARAQSIDMTKFFCDRRLCYTVVGGALVFKDYQSHLTPVFGRTLAPYLLRELRRAMRSWPAG